MYIYIYVYVVYIYIYIHIYIYIYIHMCRTSMCLAEDRAPSWVHPQAARRPPIDYYKHTQSIKLSNRN